MKNNSGNISNLMVPLVVAGFVIAGLVLGVAVGPIYGWMLLALGVFGSMLVGRPRAIILFYWLWASVSELVMTVTNSPLVRYADELFVLAIIGVSLMEFITHRQGVPELRIFRRISIALVAITLLSAVINSVSIKLAFHFFVSYLAFIPVFYLAYTSLRPRDYKSLVWILVAIFLLQLVLNIGWLVGINPLPNRFLGKIDFSIGSLGASNHVAYLSILLFIAAWGLLRIYRGMMPVVLAMGTALCSLWQFYVTSTNHAYLLLAGAIGAYYVLIRRTLRHRWMPIVLVLTFTALVLVGLSRAPISKLPGQAGYGFSGLETLRQRWAGMVNGPKGQVVQHVLVQAPKSHPLLPIIGAGPGSYLSTIGIINIVPLAKDSIGDFFLTYSGRRELTGGSILQHTVIGYLAIYSELGLLGLVAFCAIYGYAAGRVFRQYHRGRYTRSDQRLLAELFLIVTAIYAAVNLLTDYLWFDFWQVTIWVLAAAAWTPYPRQEEDAAEESAAAAEDRPIPIRLRLRRPLVSRLR